MLDNNPTLARAAALTTVLVGLLLSVSFEMGQNNRLRSQFREEVLEELGQMRTEVESMLEHHLSIATSASLAVSIREELDPSEFEVLADGFAREFESFVRLDVRTNTTSYSYARRDDLEIAKELNNVRSIELRTELKPDGEGYWLKVAVPIGQVSESADEVPLVVVMYDLDVALASGQLYEQFEDLDYLLADPQNRNSAALPFAGDPAVLERQPVSSEVRFENLTWQIAATPEGGWGVAPPTRLWARISDALLAFGAGAAVWFVLETPSRRARAVREAVAGLEQSEQRHRTLVENANTIVIQLSRTGEVEFFNQFASNVFGISYEESLGKDLGSLLAHPDRVYSLHECLRNSLRNGHEDREVECVRSSGSRVWIAWNFKAIRNARGQVTGAIATGIDVTLRHEAEAELRSSESELRGLLEAMTDTIFTVNRAGHYVHVFSTRATRSLERDRLVGQSVIDVLGKDVGGNVLGQIQTCLDRRQPIEFEYNTGRDEKRQWLDAMVSPFGDDLAILVARDVSARHMAEAELREAKAQLEARVAARAGEINDANKTLQREVVERMQIEDALRESEEREREKASELQTTLGELKRAQAQLVQTEKMSSLGQLAAGMAHEINNPVNFIHGNIRPLRDYTGDLLALVELFKREYPQGNDEIDGFIEEIDYNFLCEDLDKALDSMQVGTERIRAIINSLQNFSRLDETGMKRVDLIEGIHSALNVLKSRFRAADGRPEIQVRCDLTPLPKVMCYPSQINQVAIDIIDNSIDALAEKYVGHKAEHAEPPEISIRTEALDEERVSISIADNANGMSPETAERVFNPFFTTKPVGEGTGLGLSVAYQTINDTHDGQLLCRSVLGKGTEFQIILPIANREKVKIQQSTESDIPEEL